MEEAATCYNGLPEPLWDDILFAVGIEECHLRPISTMSKQLFSVSNRLKETLHITTNNAHCLPRLFQRFPNIKHINLPFFIDPAKFFGEIARFNISLESLDMSLMSTFPIKNFKELQLSNLSTTLRSLKLTYVEDQSDCDGDLEIIAELLPNLEELELFWSCKVTDNGVAKLSSNLKKLRKISIAGNFSVTDASIESLVQNCPDLEEIVLNQCTCITSEGVSFAFQHCKKLKSFVLQDMYDIGHGGPLPLARSLSSLEFSSMIVSDELLRAIGRANIPLRRLSLSNCKRFTLQGILPLLGAYHSLLEYFAIESLHSRRQLKSETLVYIAPYLWNVKTVKLNYCCQLSTAQLLGLVHSCRSLNTLEIKGADITKDQEPFTYYSDRKSQLRSLNLSFNQLLTDKCLATVARACPYLSRLFVNGCKEITHKGFCQVTRNCVGLRTIEMNGCDGVFTLGLNATVGSYKLEVLEARGSSLCDEDLRMIALKCPDLMLLDVTKCRYVTGCGVREVATKCRNLGKLRVSFKSIDPDTEYWIRSKKPWLVNRYV